MHIYWENIILMNIDIVYVYAQLYYGIIIDFKWKYQWMLSISANFETETLLYYQCLITSPTVKIISHDVKITSHDLFVN